MKKLSILLLALSVAAPVLADDDDLAGGLFDDDDGVVAHAPRLAQAGRSDRGPHDGRRAEIRERVKNKIQTYVTVELATRAGLDEKKSLQLGDAVKAHIERKQQARQQKRAELEKLRALVDGKGKDDAVKAQLAALLASDGHEAELRRFVDDTARFLTPTEQAKVLLALPDVMKDTRKMVREARGQRGGEGGRFRDRR